MLRPSGDTARYSTRCVCPDNVATRWRPGYRQTLIAFVV